MSAPTVPAPATPTPAAKPSRSSRSTKPARQTRPTRPARPVREVRPGEPEEALVLVSSALTIVAIVCAWMLLQTLVLGSITHARSQDLLYGQLRSELAAATLPTGALDYNNDPVEPGAPVALLTIPSIGLQEVVVSGTASGDLANGPGHERNTPLPGQAGYSVVMGRSATYGAPFADLGTLVKGAVIEVQNAEAKVTYTVADVRRPGDPLPTPVSGEKAGMLTLVTGEGEGALGALRPQTVIYVDATTTQATPAGVVAAAIPESEEPMGRDTAALPVLVILLAALAALVLAISWARRRFGPVLVWVMATPVVIALAWSVTDQVMRLLPNLM